MNFIEAVRLVYDLANGMEPVPDEASTPDLRRQMQEHSEALDLVCEWLHAQQEDRGAPSRRP